MKRFERHVKRDVAVVNVRRFVLLVDNWTQTGARPPMIDHATQTGFPALLDAETQTGEYTVQDVEVHAPVFPRYIEKVLNWCILLKRY